jgi:hypothetical protein
MQSVGIAVAVFQTKLRHKKGISLQLGGIVSKRHTKNLIFVRMANLMNLFGGRSPFRVDRKI